jgi:hypothetical protein
MEDNETENFNDFTVFCGYCGTRLDENGNCPATYDGANTDENS